MKSIEISDHYHPEDWVDLVRGTLPESKAQEMREHLRSGCQPCRNSSEIWGSVAELCAHESTSHPSEGTVRIAKSLFTPEHQWRWLPRIAHYAKLVFDSLREPAPVGVRSSKGPDRHLVHEIEPFVIDLRLESDPHRKRLFLMGQILNSRQPEQNGSSVDIILLSGERLVTKTSASDSGEFNLELSPEADQQLFINIRGQRAIGIALPTLDV